MTPRTLCIIEPGATALPDEFEQLSGLIVTTIAPIDARSWEVAPMPFVRYTNPTFSRNGAQIEAGSRTPVYIPGAWLRPILGDGAPGRALSKWQAEKA